MNERNFFVKMHGLGNEYMVVEDSNLTFPLGEKAIRRVCNVNYGVGTDGVLVKARSQNADFGLRIFNPDGSEAEKSGNGLRIFAKFLYDYRYTNNRRFTIETAGGVAGVEIVGIEDGRARYISVNMGKADFSSKNIPTAADTEETIGVDLDCFGKLYQINCVSVGNPHCVILKNELDINEIKQFGSILENHRFFPNRINVQFARVINRQEVEILIWERGAGFTLASGSSACAATSVLKKLGLVDGHVKVHMMGGDLSIEVADDWTVSMVGEVRQIAEGHLSDEFVEDLIRP